MKKIIAVLLTVAMLASALVMVGANASPVADYATAEPGDLLYTVNFNGDSAFSPAAIVAGGSANFDDNFDAIVSADGSSVTLKGKATGTTETVNYWGGIINGLAADANTHYTMIYKAKSNANEKNDAVGVGGYALDNTFNAGGHYNNYCNHSTTNTPRAALSKGPTKSLSYIEFSTIAAYDVDSDGFVTMINDFDGATYTSYILKDGAEATLDADMTNWIKLQELTMTLDTSNSMCFVAYCYRTLIDTTIKDVKFYKGLNAEAETPAETTYNIPAILEAHGVEHVKLTSAKTPTLDGVIGENEYSATNVITNARTDIYSAPTSLGPNDKFTEYFAYDANYIYFGVATQNQANGKPYYFQILPDETVDAAGLSTYLTRFMGYWNQVTANGDSFTVNDGIRASDSATFYQGYAFGTEFAGTYDSATKVGVMEFKVSRDFLDAEYGREAGETKTFAFFTRYWSGTLVLAQTLDAGMAADLNNTTNGFAPRYIVIEGEDADIATKQSASVRFSDSENGNGLRFKTKVSVDLINELKAVDGNVVEVGTLIAKTDVLNGATLDHNFEGIKLDVKANIDMPFEEGEIYNTYAGSITKLKDYNLAKDFTAVGYIKVTNGESVQYIYSTTVANKSAASVATAALSDVAMYAPDNALGDEDYAYKVEDNYIAAFEGKDRYSPYTAEQRELMAKLVPVA